MREDEGFLSRWSRLKRAGSDENDGDQVLQAGSDLSAQQLPADESVAEPPVLTDEDMPPIESLTEDSDYSGFMSPGVSDELRQLALRKLFRSAAFNVCDGLDDYDDDYTSFEKLGDIITSDMRFQMEQEAKKKMQAMLEDDGGESVETDIEQDPVPEDAPVAAMPAETNDHAYDKESDERDDKSPQQSV